MSVPALAALLILIGTLFSGLFSGAETGAYQFNRTRHRLALADGNRRAHLVQGMTSDLTAFVVVCLIGTNLANSLVSYSATLAFTHLEFGTPELISTLTIAPILFILGELAPKELFRRHADRLVYATGPLLRLSALVFWPLSKALGLVSFLLRLFGLRPDEEHTQSEERLRHAIAAGAEGGTLTAYQATIARNIFSLRTRRVLHAMIPLARVDALEASMELEAARAEIRSTGRGRYPVYRNQIDQIVGIANFYDLLFEEHPGLTIRNYIQDALLISPYEKVAEALVRMRRARCKIAVVAQDGKAMGIITLKDLVEEITGELRDL